MIPLAEHMHPRRSADMWQLKDRKKTFDFSTSGDGGSSQMARNRRWTGTSAGGQCRGFVTIGRRLEREYHVVSGNGATLMEIGIRKLGQPGPGCPDPVRDMELPSRDRPGCGGIITPWSSRLPAVTIGGAANGAPMLPCSRLSNRDTSFGGYFSRP